MEDRSTEVIELILEGVPNSDLPARLNVTATEAIVLVTKAVENVDTWDLLGKLKINLLRIEDLCNKQAEALKSADKPDWRAQKAYLDTINSVDRIITSTLNNFSDVMAAISKTQADEFAEMVLTSVYKTAYEMLDSELAEMFLKAVVERL